MNAMTVGTKVEVPQHFRPRGTARQYDRGTIVELERGFATIALDDGRHVHTAVGILRKVSA